MDLRAQLTALREETRELNPVERAKRSCEMAKRLEKIGEYEAACEALSEYWPERDTRLNLNDLDEATGAEVLLRAGALSGWLGSTDQTEGSQETAKNLITRSIELFQRLGLSDRLAEARGDLALCYWREGGFDEARATLTEAFDSLGEKDSDLRALLLIRAGIIEERTQQFHEAMRFYSQAAPLLDRSQDHALKGSFHAEYGSVFLQLATPQNRQDYLDRALMEYTAASFHLELAGNIRYLARLENNLGYLFFKIGKYNRAHRHLDRARHFFTALKDTGAAAQVDDTRARTLLAESRVAEAERVARYAVHILDRGDEQAVLAEALTTHAVALARLANYSAAKSLLRRAIKVADTAGDLEGAGRARLSIIEELSGQTPDEELFDVWLSADELLRNSQDPATTKRLIACGRKLIQPLTIEPAEVQAAKVTDWKRFSIKEALRKTERAVIERALKASGGAVSRAAYMLGYKHHQSLISILNLRHPDLQKMRSAVRKRRVPVSSRLRRGRPRGVKKHAARRTSQISILYVEDDARVANLVADMCAKQNWRAELCTDRDSALRKLTGNDHYDLLLFDHDLCRVNGSDLIERARNIIRFRRTPIILLSGSERESAWRTRATAVLRKPEDVQKVPATIARLLKIKLKGK